jgi:CubicO group peptidase (beta-lactamase class C family)
MSNIAHKTLGLVTVMVLGITAPALAAAQNQAPTTPASPPATTSEPDPAAVQKVADAITAAIAALPATASEQDVEAAISFAVSQQGQNAAVNVAALTYVAKQPGNQSRKV